MAPSLENLQNASPNGYFSARIARRAGVGSGELRRLVNDGAITTLIRGWYALPPTSDSTVKHRLATLAALDHFAGSAQASHVSALVLHGLPTLPQRLDSVMLTRRTGRSNRRTEHVWSFQALPPLPEALRAESANAVHPAIAVIQTGLIFGADDAFMAADTAKRRGLITDQNVRDSMNLFTRCAGIGALHTPLAWADGRQESSGESLAALRLRTMGVAFTAQPWIECRGLRFRPDFRIEGSNILVEFDGRLKYANAEDLYAEKRREDDLRADGWIIVRLVWEDLWHGGVQAKLEIAAALAGTSLNALCRSMAA